MNVLLKETYLKCLWRGEKTEVIAVLDYGSMEPKWKVALGHETN